MAASKTKDELLRDAICATEDPMEAKRMGSKALGKADSVEASAWKAGSIAIMGAVLRDKFRRTPR